jgi:hypothetical protein
MTQTPEQAAMKGLDLIGYRGKWEKAKQLADANERSDENRLLPYWERVRLLFLELGGKFTSGESQ